MRFGAAEPDLQTCQRASSWLATLPRPQDAPQHSKEESDWYQRMLPQAQHGPSGPD